jgi:hypothetical protein
MAGPYWPDKHPFDRLAGCNSLSCNGLHHFRDLIEFNEALRVRIFLTMSTP